MRLFKFASSFVKGLLLAAVLALMLAACGGAAPAPTQATPATPPQSTANPVQPTPQPSPTTTPTPNPTPTPTPTPIPYSEMTGLQEMLAREFGAWPMLVRADHNAKVVGEFGNLVVKQGDVVSIYRALDGYFVTAGPIANLISTKDAEELFGHSVESAPTIEVKDEKDLRQKIKYAKEWLEYLDHWKMPRYVDSLVDRNGNPLDLHRFFNGINNKEDYQYALDYIKWRLGNQQVYYHLNLVSVGRSNASPEEVLRAIYTIYQYSRFDPEVNMVGMDTLNLWRLSDFSSSWTLARLGITLPFKDDYGDIHTNIDFGANPDWVVHNPFTHVKVKEVWFWYDESIGSLRQAYESGRLNASVHVMVTPPDGGKPVEFYFAHLDGSKGSVLDELLKSNGFTPLNAEYRGGVRAELYKLYVNGRMSLEPGQKFASLDNPDNDPWSEGWHIEFGVYPRIEDYRNATLMAIAILFHPHPEQYLPPLPPVAEQGYWKGKSNGRYASIPQLGERALRKAWQEWKRQAFLDGYKTNLPGDGLYAQLSAYERISGRNPARALRRRQKFTKPKHYA